jgi:hypothetical protein
MATFLPQSSPEPQDPQNTPPAGDDDHLEIVHILVAWFALRFRSIGMLTVL